MQLCYLYWRVSKGNCSNPLFIVTEHPPSLLSSTSNQKSQIRAATCRRRVLYLAEAKEVTVALLLSELP